ncbi:MAG TPA: DUF3108 domain-containing protein [Ignavibacteria bacterium]|nr:DUF3108 domain-containing protein [Ignavibacteria bacterium]
MNKFPCLNIAILLVLLNSASLNAQEKVLEVGEELTYEVYFGFIKLGKVNFKVTNTFTENKKEFYTAKAEMKSYEGVPLVNVNYIFETTMQNDKQDVKNEKKEVFSTSFYSTEFKNKSISRIEYDFDYDKREIKVMKETDNEISDSMKVKFDENIRYQDGLSIFYNARLQSFSNKNYNMPVFVNDKVSSLKYSFNINEDIVDIDMFDYDVKAIKIAGVADFVGVMGLTGEFAGWLSADDYRIPLKASFNVIIGSITLELINYKRTNWTAPKFE